MIFHCYRQDDLNTSVSSDRLDELKRRNKTVPPHLKSCYPLEMSRVSTDKAAEEVLKSDENTPPVLSTPKNTRTPVSHN